MTGSTLTQANGCSFLPLSVAQTDCVVFTLARRTEQALEPGIRKSAGTSTRLDHQSASHLHIAAMAMKRKAPGAGGKRPAARSDPVAAVVAKAPAEKVVVAATAGGDEEESFKRGGGEILTPLERREIEMRAERDMDEEMAAGETGKGAKKAEPKAKRVKGDTTDAAVSGSKCIQADQ